MSTLVEQVDALLPQTQCGQCGYAACLPYAQAVVNAGEAIDRCPPGGVKLLSALAALLGKDVQASLVEIEKRASPHRTAFIRETECIACTKCIQACPVDAIIGAPKQAHTILTQECTGCGLCVEPCPVDCIDMLVLTSPVYRPEKARQRFQAKKARTKRIATPSRQTGTQKTPNNLRAYVDAAVTRAKAKKA